MSAWTGAERASIRMYLGYSTLASQYDAGVAFLDSRLTALQTDHDDDQTLIRSILTKLDGITDELYGSRLTTGVMSADQGEAELDIARGNATLCNLGRMFVTRLATIVDVPVHRDSFGPTRR